MKNPEKVITIGLDGDFQNGFNISLEVSDSPRQTRTIGYLPANENIVDNYKKWRDIYLELQYPGRIKPKDIQLTRSSDLPKFFEMCRKKAEVVEDNLNNWWKSSNDFNKIRESLSRELDTTKNVRVLLQTDNNWLRRLPWHRWDLLNGLEVALSAPEYDFSQKQNVSASDRVRILALFGEGANLPHQKDDKEILDKLLERERAEIAWEFQPSPEELNRLLAQECWDILFFSGHSASYSDGSRCEFQLTADCKLGVAEIKEGLKLAINRGLRLAIFNSCDGLGLAHQLAAGKDLYLPQVIVMREKVPDAVAPKFLEHFLRGFIGGNSLYEALQFARRELQMLDWEYPCASWLPVICQNPMVAPPSWVELVGAPVSPYRGLAAFREEDAEVFFGREAFAENLAVAVRQQPLVAVIGASGSGKSSVVFAGLVPLLRNSSGGLSWEVLDFRPRNDPFMGLAGAIASLLGKSESEIAVEFKSEPSSLSTFLKTIAKLGNNRSKKVLLIADRLEELYTPTLERKDRELFLDCLLHAVNNVTAFTLVLTLRADFWERVIEYLPLKKALEHYPPDKLLPMDAEELRQAIKKPAQQRNVELDEVLTENIIKDLRDAPGSLPLLQLVLESMWKQQNNFWLSHQVYHTIGGVAQVLRNHGDDFLSDLSDSKMQQVKQVFAQLVQPGDQNTKDTRRVATLAEIGEKNWDLVAWLADERLVVTDVEDGSGEPVVKIAHEALIDWKELQKWTREWSDLRSSQEQKRRWRVNIVRSVIGVVAFSVLFVGMVWQSRRAVVREMNAKIETKIETLRDLANISLDRELKVIALAKELQDTQGVSPENRKRAVKLLEQTFDFSKWKEYNRLEGHQNWVYHVSFSPDGKFLATASEDQTVRVWQIDGKLLTTIEHQESVYRVSFSPDSKFLATASADQTGGLWQVNGIEVALLTGHKSSVNYVSFSSDGKLLATASWDMVRLWQTDGTLVASLTKHQGLVSDVSFSPNGKLLATASCDMVRLWETDGRLVATLTGHQERVSDGKSVATASTDQTARLCETDDTSKTPPIISQVSFSPDGKLLATASDDNTVRLWETDGTPLPIVIRHKDDVKHISFSPNSKLLAVASDDDTVRLWQIEGTVRATLTEHQGDVKHLSFSPNGKLLAVASDDNTVRLWETGDGDLVTTLIGHQDDVNHVSFSPDGNFLATASDDKTLRLWQIGDTSTITFNRDRDSSSHKSFSRKSKQSAAANNENILPQEDSDLDALLIQACDWVRDYLTNNPDVSEEQKHLCDDVGN